MKKLLILVLLFAFIPFVIGATTTLQCQFRDNSCLTEQGEVAFLYANGHEEFTDSQGRVLSSHIATKFDSNYNKVLCCKSPYGNLYVTFQDVNSECIKGDELMYFANDGLQFNYNYKSRFKDFELLNKSHVLENFDISNYNNKSCVVKPDEFALFDVVASDRDYSLSGYTCMYRISDLENGVISDCNATFNNGNQYKYAVWGRLWEDISSIKCNVDCTSKLDGRVYSVCSTQIEACRGIPTACDGALLGSWIPELDSSNVPTGNELLCSAPWNVVRGNLFTTESLDIKSVNDKCENLISKSYPVIIDNNQVNMRIYVCGD